jgi:hypothetical protein
MFVYSVSLHPDKDAEGVQPHNEGFVEDYGRRWLAAGLWAKSGKVHNQSGDSSIPRRIKWQCQGFLAKIFGKQCKSIS